VTALLRAVWDLVVGEDWILALGAAIALGVTAALAAAGLPAWWVAPALIPGALLASIRRAVRPRRRASSIAPAASPGRRRRRTGG
jgi:membrane protein implicated in regulation of membrane protease activity